MSRHFDVIVLGAGISGIDAAWHLKNRCPTFTFTVLERRFEIGGTWSLFKYPGLRSDSDMRTFGFFWHPWASTKNIAPKKEIQEYLHTAVLDFDLERHIEFGVQVTSAAWDTAAARWSLSTTAGERYTCGFLFGCTGYYDHDTPYRPAFPGEENFKGRIVHPQHWGPEDDADYPGKRVAVIGSGATAVTMLPNLVKGGAAHVTMVQRTPTYIFAGPEHDGLAAVLSKVLPESVTHSIMRWKNVSMGTLVFNLCQRWPERSKKFFIEQARQHMGGHMSDAEFDKHFTPPYNPWDQRLCLSPAGDFFGSFKDGKASVVTDHIERFTETGILMRGGEHVEADTIVTATGLTMQANFPMAKMVVTVDGKPYKANTKFVYRGSMLSDVPNFAFIIGYTNASWTLKADLTCLYVCRLLQKMKAEGIAVCRPSPGDDIEIDTDIMALSSGYVSRAKDTMPNQGAEAPWKVYQNYFRDGLALRYGSLDDGSIKYTRSTMSGGSRL